MPLNQFLLAMFAALPEGKVAGKKRLQKLVYLLQQSGADVDADFQIHHYGPFSYDVAEAVDDLLIDEDLEEESERGVYQTFQTTYVLNTLREKAPRLNPKSAELLLALDSFSTVELEVGSTILYFMERGCSFDDAVAETKEIKRSKTIPPVVTKAQQVIALVHEKRSAVPANARSTHPRSYS